MTPAQRANTRAEFNARMNLRAPRRVCTCTCIRNSERKKKSSIKMKKRTCVYSHHISVADMLGDIQQQVRYQCLEGRPEGEDEDEKTKRTNYLANEELTSFPVAMRVLSYMILHNGQLPLQDVVAQVPHSSTTTGCENPLINCESPLSFPPSRCLLLFRIANNFPASSDPDFISSTLL